MIHIHMSWYVMRSKYVFYTFKFSSVSNISVLLQHYERKQTSLPFQREESYISSLQNVRAFNPLPLKRCLRSRWSQGYTLHVNLRSFPQWNWSWIRYEMQSVSVSSAMWTVAKLVALCYVLKHKSLLDVACTDKQQRLCVRGSIYVCV
jgi:hypothetical protein